MAGKSGQQKHEAMGCVILTIRKQRAMNVCLSLLVLSIKFRTQDLRMVEPTFSVNLPTSINLAHIISSQTCTKTTKSFKDLSID